MKHRAPQFHLPLAGESFRLVGERAEQPLCQACGLPRLIVTRDLCRDCADAAAENDHRDFFRD